MGLLVGISGVGGSSLMAPLLILVVRLNPLTAVGVDLLYSVPTKLLGALVHWRQGTVNRTLLLRLILGGIPGAILGLLVLVQLRHMMDAATLNAVIKHAVGVMLIMVAVLMLSARLFTRAAKQENTRSVDEQRWRIVGLGVLVGFCVSLTSIGSGALTVPILILLLPRLGLKQVVGSNIAFAAVLVPISAAGHLGLGDVDVRVTLNLLLGSLPGVFIGSKLCDKLPEMWLRSAMAGILIWAGVVLV